jgi:alpha-amylase
VDSERQQESAGRRNFLIAATGVSVTPKTATVTVGGTKELTAAVTPSNSTDTVTWSSSDKTVATVAADGTVTAVATGSATITATAGTQTATCAVTVKAAQGN